jgi:uncharacterized protein (DUF433 family)
MAKISGEFRMITMPVAIDVPLRTDEDGEIRVGNTRVTLMTIVGCYKRGDTPEEIHEAFSAVALADVYTVIAYYLNHRQEVDDYIRHTEANAERLRQELEANNAKLHSALEEKRKKE